MSSIAAVVDPPPTRRDRVAGGASGARRRLPPPPVAGVRTGDGETAPGRQPDMGRRLRSGGLWAVFSKVVALVSTLTVNALLGHALSPRDFGAFALLSSVAVFVSNIAMFGLHRSLLRFIAEGVALSDARRLRRALGLGAVVGPASVLVTGAACWAAWRVIALRFFGAPELVPLGLPMALWVVVLAATRLVGEMLRGFHEIRFASLFSAPTGGPLSLAAFVAVLTAAAAWATLSLGLAIVTMVACLAAALPFLLACLAVETRARLDAIAAGPDRPDSASGAPRLRDDTATVPHLPRLSLAGLLSVSLPLMFAQVLYSSTQEMDIWLAGHLVSRGDLALYGAARRLIQPLSTALQFAELIVISAIAHLYAQRRLGELQRLLRSTATLAAAPALAILLVLLVYPGPGTLLATLFGPAYRGGATVLVILTIGRLAYVWTGSCGLALTMTGRHNADLLVNVASTACLLALAPVASRHFGVTGLACVTTGCVLLQNLGEWLLARRLVGVWTHAGLPTRAELAAVYRRLTARLGQAARPE